MREVSRDERACVLEFTKDELILIYGCITEATEALSESEFRARIGHDEKDAFDLLSSLRAVID